ncbi:hypothetical protein [Bartonella sp. MM73XJBT.G]|uniref:hypothetical protein n=1 Tax=Bartonella sp. MM73XJBT.G TaxID=3019097 RepID=UPI002362BC30|nr:hypothetical protein [Bartonella sp. MM73XJBT.G]
MSNDLFFWLLLVFACILAVGLLFLHKAAARRGVRGWLLFWRWVVLYGLMALYLGFICAGVRSVPVSEALLLKGAVFSCIFTAVLGVMHLSVKSLPVAWVRFVKLILFCGMIGVILWLFVVGVGVMNSTRGLFLKVLVLALLWKLLLWFFIRAQSDTLVQRVLYVLNYLLFICIWVLVLSFAFLGAERLGWSWLWFSNQDVSSIMRISLFLLIYQGVKSARRDVGSFFKKVGF